MNSTSVRLALLVLGSLVLVSCGPTAAPTVSAPAPTRAASSDATSATLIPTLSPTASSTPQPTAAPTEPPSPSPQPTSTPVPPAAEPSATPASTSVVIEIVGQSTQHTFIRPGQTATLPYWREYVALVHYPYPLGSNTSSGFRPYSINVDVSPPDWQPEIRNFPNNSTLNLHLLGTKPGKFVVIINAGPQVQQVAFTLEVQPPAVTATPAPTQPSSQARSVTLADNNQTIQLHTGERFLLDLGTGYDWTVNVANPSIVSRVVNVLVIQGAQGIYEAKQPGTTTLTATGDPPCRKATPPCALPSRIFQIHIVVQ